MVSVYVDLGAFPHEVVFMSGQQRKRNHKNLGCLHDAGITLIQLKTVSTSRIHSRGNMVDLLERLDVLLKLECVSEDYLSPSFQQQLQVDSEAIETQSFCSSSTSTAGINEVWREKICEWSYQVIDHFDFSREVVSISIHFLDRFLSTRPVNKKTFQVAAMTTLYLAVKLYEPGTISMKSMLGLSRGYFTVKQMEDMEFAILR